MKNVVLLTSRRQSSFSLRYKIVNILISTVISSKSTFFFPLQYPQNDFYIKFMHLVVMSVFNFRF